MNKVYIVLLVLSISASGYSQVGINTATPDDSAMLDISSSNKGVLFPRMDLDDLEVAAPVASPAIGLTVWNTRSGAEGLYYWDGIAWLKYNSAHTIGDIKHGFQNTDHKGWYLLDGRAVNLLSSNVQAVASSLGFTGNLPDATNRVLKAKTTTEALGSQVGNNSINLVAANIPQLTGTTNTEGDHSHNYDDDEFTSTDVRQVTLVGVYNNINVLKTAVKNVKNTSTSGSHDHTVTVNAGSTNESIDTTPASIVTNVFVYLGN